MLKLSGYRHFSWRFYNIIERIYWKLCLLHCLWVCSLSHAFEAASWLISSEAVDWFWYWGHFWRSRRCSSKHFQYISLFFYHLCMVGLTASCSLKFVLDFWPFWIFCSNNFAIFSSLFISMFTLFLPIHSAVLVCCAAPGCGKNDYSDITR